jgi:hypothetical protein
MMLHRTMTKMAGATDQETQGDRPFADNAWHMHPRQMENYPPWRRREMSNHRVLVKMYYIARHPPDLLRSVLLPAPPTSARFNPPINGLS